MHEAKTDVTERRNQYIHNYIGDFNTPLSEISKDTEEMNNTINQQDLMNNYRILHETTTEHTFFPCTFRIFTKTDDIMGHKANPNEMETK